MVANTSSPFRFVGPPGAAGGAAHPTPPCHGMLLAAQQQPPWFSCWTYGVCFWFGLGWVGGRRTELLSSPVCMPNTGCHFSGCCRQQSVEPRCGKEGGLHCGRHAGASAVANRRWTLGAAYLVACGLHAACGLLCQSQADCSASATASLGVASSTHASMPSQFPAHVGCVVA